jgi:2-polyprenyl-6-methoxyphenol hydroxylase-like FAD-dependent oxidoreductase
MRYGNDLRLLIVGGGIAGLTVAAALEQRGMRADIVERAQNYGGVGFVLGVWPAGLNVLNSMGLRAELMRIGLPPGMYHAMDPRSRQLTQMSLGEFAAKYGDNLYLSRAGLIDVLRAAVSSPIVFGRSITALRPSEDAVAVTFNDGSTAEYDAVIGADGLRSQTRRLLFGEVPLTYHGVTGWAFWTGPELGSRIGSETREIYGPGRFMGFYPSLERPCCFAAAASPRNAADDPATRRSRLETIFAGFPEWARAALGSSNDPTIWHDDFLDLRLPRWTSGRVALVGDAAHAILPSAGVGASMAIESAYVLADELSRASSVQVAAALCRYEQRRRARTDRVQRQSRQLMWMIRPRNPIITGVRDAAMRMMPSSTFQSMFKPLMSSGI